MEFSRLEYWSELPFPSPGDLPDPGIKATSLALQADSLPLCHQGSLLIGKCTLKLWKEMQTLVSENPATESWPLSLCFCLEVNSQQGEQNLQTLSIQEGESVTMNCSYKSITITALQWYRQDSRRGFVHLILMRSNERQKHSGRLLFTLDSSIQSSSVSIAASQAEDTATYFCAPDTQCSAGTCSPSADLPELSLRSRDRVQSWWFCLPTKESLQTASNTKGSSSQIPEFSVACQTIVKGMGFRTGSWNAKFSPAHPGCVFSHIIGVAAFSVLSLNKGFRLMSLKTLQVLILPGHLWRMKKDFSVLEGYVCYMCSPLKT